MATVETNYEVAAKLHLAGLQRTASTFTRLGASIRGANTGLNSMTRNLLVLGGSYIGIRALSGGISRLTRTALGFNAELEKTQIGLAAVVSAVDGMPFEQALGPAREIFTQLRSDAITSAATTQEMFQIFQGIVGPIRNAGFGMEKVRELTNSTVSAASALNVDFAQAQRDITLMTRGAAGMDTKLFSLLRSTGAIAETTKEWNQGMSAEERVVKLSEALNKFKPAAEAYGKSWAGITSSFKDITTQLLGVAAGPAFESIKRFLKSINDRMIANRTQLEALAMSMGESIGGMMDRVFAHANKGIEYVTRNWDTIVTKIHNATELVKTMGPALVKAAVALSVGRQVVGGGLMAAGAGASGLQGLMTMGLGGSASAAGAGGAAAAGASGAGGAAGGAAMFAATWPLVVAGLAALAAIATVVGSVVVLLTEHWNSAKNTMVEFMPIIQHLWEQIKHLGGMIWEVVKPIAKLIGMVAVIAVFEGLVTVLQVASTVVTWLTKIVWAIVPAMRQFGKMVSWLAEKMFGGMTKRAKSVAGRMGAEKKTVKDAVDARVRASKSAMDAANASAEGGIGLKDHPTKNVTNDFRNSRIQVKQEFRQADPDRVAIQMIEGINRQAESRVQSGFAPALTR